MELQLTMEMVSPTCERPPETSPRPAKNTMTLHTGSALQILRIVLLLCVSLTATAQTTDIVVLNAAEQNRLNKVIRTNNEARGLYDSIASLAIQSLQDTPAPVKHIHYEGLLQTNPARIATRRSLEDMDKVTNLIYAYYGNPDKRYARKAKEIALAWCAAYEPNGNPINENKLTAIFWAYHLFKSEFTPLEKRAMQQWMRMIAQEEMGRTGTPENNWEAKRQKITATIGCVLNDKSMRTVAVEGFKQYIHNAYYADGTSNDLRERDALHYHLSGLTPCIAVFINCKPFDSRLDLYGYEAPSGSSIKKSLEYALPYATGEKERKEWVNSRVKLDKERAAAGLPEYQPGMRFDPKDALPAFAWASFYNPDWYALLGKETSRQNQAAKWVGLLNSQVVRKKG